MPKRYMISGGGTGGHIYPAVAVARALREADPDCQILFAGAEGKMEMEKVPKAGFDIVGLPIRGLQRRLTLENLWLPFRLIGSLWKAHHLVKQWKPDVVIGSGGYASAAVLYVAARIGVPCLIMEQNSYAGLTNKLLASRVQKICVAYPDMERYFPAQKLIFTGNPVRSDIMAGNISREEALAHFGLDSERPVLLSIGGSLGARTINEAMLRSLETWKAKGVQLLWQTGKAFEAQARKATEAANVQQDVHVYDFIYDMHYAYAAADAVISRAGALSISELALAGKATILVPSPNVAEDHQTKNAMALVAHKAALLVSDAEAGTTLTDVVLQLLEAEEERKILENNIRTLARPQATSQIVAEIHKILHQV